MERAGAYGSSTHPSRQPPLPFTHSVTPSYTYLFTPLFISSFAALSVHTSTDPLICVLTHSFHEQKEKTMTGLIRETRNQQRTTAQNDCTLSSPGRS